MIYGFCRILRQKKNISKSYSKLICHENFPIVLISACFIKHFSIFFVETKKIVKFGKFWIVQACEDASVKNHTEEAREPLQK